MQEERERNTYRSHTAIGEAAEEIKNLRRKISRRNWICCALGLLAIAAVITRRTTTAMLAISQTTVQTVNTLTPWAEETDPRAPCGGHNIRYIRYIHQLNRSQGDPNAQFRHWDNYFCAVRSERMVTRDFACVAYCWPRSSTDPIMNTPPPIPAY